MSQLISIYILQLCTYLTKWLERQPFSEETMEDNNNLLSAASRYQPPQSFSYYVSKLNATILRDTTVNINWIYRSRINLESDEKKIGEVSRDEKKPDEIDTHQVLI